MASTMCSRSVAASTRVEKPMMGRVPVAAPKKAVAARVSTRPISSKAPRAAEMRLSVSTAATAAPAAQTTEAPAKTEWYAVVANCDFFFVDPQNESLAEQLRERVRLFKEKGDEVNFWLVPNPAWLDAKFPEKAKQVKRPCVALVSTDKLWMQFMKLRLDRVMWLDLGDMPVAEVSKSTAKLPEKFDPPAKWTAPYSMYTPGWWNVFIPDSAK